MKQFALIFFSGCVLHACAFGNSGYPSHSEAATLFSSNAINSGACLAGNVEYQNFIRRLSECSLMQDSASVESAVLNGAASFVINVSTNAVDDGTPACVLYDRANLLLDCVRHFRFSPAGSTNLANLCSHLANVRPVPYNDELTRMRGGVHLFNLSTNKGEIAKFNERTRKREKNIEQRRIQVRVKNMNEAVHDYQRKMSEAVGLCMAGYRITMDDCQYADLTNQLFRVMGSHD